MKRAQTIGMVLVFMGIIGTGAYVFVASKQDEATHVTLYGNVDIRQVSLGFRVAGRVQDLHFEEGDRVKKGDLLATLDQKPYLNRVNAAKAALAQKKAAHENAFHISARKEKLVKSKFASVEDYQTTQTTEEEAFALIQAAQADLDTATTDFQDTSLMSPSTGTILSRVHEVGAIVGAGDSVYVLSLDAPMWVRAYVSETDLGRLHLGMQAQVYTDANPQKPYTGQVGFISPIAEFTPKNVETPELRTKLVYRLKVIIKDPDPFLRRGMPVTVHLKTQ